MDTDNGEDESDSDLIRILSSAFDDEAKPLGWVWTGKETGKFRFVGVRFARRRTALERLIHADEPKVVFNKQPGDRP